MVASRSAAPPRKSETRMRSIMEKDERGGRPPLPEGTFERARLAAFAGGHSNINCNGSQKGERERKRQGEGEREGGATAGRTSAEKEISRVRRPHPPSSPGGGTRIENPMCELATRNTQCAICRTSNLRHVRLPCAGDMQNRICNYMWRNLPAIAPHASTVLSAVIAPVRSAVHLPC